MMKGGLRRKFLVSWLSHFPLGIIPKIEAILDSLVQGENTVMKTSPLFYFIAFLK